MKKLLFYFIVVSIAFILIEGGCKQEDPAPVVVEFVLSPETLFLNDSDTAILYLSSQPSAQVDWQATAYKDWIELQPSSGTIQNNIQEVKVIAHTSEMETGDYFSEIEFISDGAGKGISAVYLTVGADPKGKVTPESLVFSEGIDVLELQIENLGFGYLNWELFASESWLQLQPSSGTTSKYQPATILAIVNRGDMPVGDYTAEVSIQSNSNESIENIDINMTVPEIATIGFDTDTVNFGYFKEGIQLEVSNTGNVGYDWELSISEDYINSNSTSGYLDPGESTQLSLTANRTSLEPDSYISNLQFSNTKGFEVELPTVVNKYNEEKWLIEGRIIDAEYDRTNDLIIAVTESPYRLLKLNPQNESVEEVSLNLLPNAVSVLPDGTQAVVGHDGKVTHIDLISMTSVEVFDVPDITYDIVIAPNNYAYVFPATGQWTEIKCLNLANGQVTASDGYSIRHRTKAKLHPSGDYIYGADTDSSPSDFEKYDIRSGTAVLMYDSPYHGDYSFGGNIWIADDGLRLFAKSRNVFFSSTNQSTDMTYNGSLSGENSFKTLDHSSAANRICAIGYAGDYWDDFPSNEVSFYDAEYLNYQGSTLLPGFLVPAIDNDFAFYESEGHFGFFNSSGNRYYVLVKAQDGSGLLNDWAVATIDVE